eukprot:1906443-Alexandrium_andersonii.AAC.1
MEAAVKVLVAFVVLVIGEAVIGEAVTVGCRQSQWMHVVEGAGETMVKVASEAVVGVVRCRRRLWWG